MNIEDVVEDINEKHMTPWGDACIAEGIVNTPLTPYIEKVRSIFISLFWIGIKLIWLKVIFESQQHSCHLDYRIGIQVLYRCLIWPHPVWVTRLHHHWGAPEAEIFVFKFLQWPVFEPRTSQSNGRERCHSTTAPPHCPIEQDLVYDDGDSFWHILL